MRMRTSTRRACAHESDRAGVFVPVAPVPSSFLGCHTGLHAAGGAELLRRRGARPERLHQRHQEQEGPHGGHRPAPVR